VLTSFVLPRPIAWVTSVGQTGVVNAAPFSSFNVFCEDPPLCMFAVNRRPDGRVKDTRTGAISRCGDQMVGTTLYEAAQILLVRTTKFKAWAMPIARRRGMKRAIVALARRLAVIMHRIWVDGTEFRCSRKAAAA